VAATVEVEEVFWGIPFEKHCLVLDKVGFTSLKNNISQRFKYKKKTCCQYLSVGI